MRPLTLSMTAFGPYAGTEVVDFEALAELGLFTVAGRNGSGKTTIFDGLHFALYGTLPGRRANYPRLRSDHARPDVECRVVLEFLAHGHHWRVERLPKQRRAKRKGTGDTERAQRATLYEMVDGAPVAVANRINEVNERCRELVGLSGPQFERVALLPQGEFSRLLRESASERRELLRALFSSEVFGEATALLSEAAAEASRTELVGSEHLERRLASLVEQVTELVATPVADDVTAVRDALERHRTAVVTPQRSAIERARAEAADHAAAVRQAIDLHERRARRAAALRALADHEADAEQHERDRARLAAARAAVPVVDIATVARNQRRALDEVHARVVELQTELAPLLERIDPALVVPTEAGQLDPLMADLDERTEHLREQLDASARVRDLRVTIDRLRNEVERLERSRRTARDQRANAQQRRRDLESERDELECRPGLDAEQARLDDAEQALAARTELAALEREASEIRRERTALETTLADLDGTIIAAERAGGQLARHEQAARSATDAVTELERRLAAHNRFVRSFGQLRQARIESEAARRRADHCFDEFIRGASARIADTLADGHPCPVCGSAEHPAPAAPSRDAIDERDVAAARDEAERLTTTVDRLEHELETLRREDPDIAELDPDRAHEDLRSHTTAAIAAENAANEAATAVAQLDHHRSRRHALAGTLRESGDRLASIERRCNQLIGALGPDARATIDDLRHRRDQAAERIETARGAAERMQMLGRQLLDLDQQVETIDLACLDLEHQLTATQAELDARIVDHTEAERRLAGPAVPDAEATLADVQRTSGLLTAVRSALAELASAADADRRAELTLGEKLAPSPFATVDEALTAHLEADVIVALEASTTAWAATGDELRGELRALGDLPDIAPDVDALRETAAAAEAGLRELEHDHARLLAAHDRFAAELDRLATERATLDEQQMSTRRLERVAALVNGDNPHNTSLENWVLAAHLRDVVELANVRLARSTRHRFQLVVLAEGENRRARWGLDLAVEDTVTGTRRPTAGLSGGELFQASLALALGLADVVMSQRSGVAIDALFIDEGFGALDDASVERVLDLLDDVRSRGATVGVITHVNALLDVLPRGITVVPSPDGNGSTIQQVAQAA